MFQVLRHRGADIFVTGTALPAEPEAREARIALRVGAQHLDLLALAAADGEFFGVGKIVGDLARGVATVTSAPADAAGLPDRGHLTPGARADIIRVTRVNGAGAVRGVWVQGNRVG